MRSLTKLGEGSNNGRDGIGGVHERWAVSRSPGELSGKSDNHWVLDEVLWRQVTDFLLHGIIGGGLWVELNHLLSSELGWVSNVVKSLNLFEMHHVVDHPELVVVGHSDVKVLHLLGSRTELTNSSFWGVFGSHEGIVLGLNLVDNVWGVHGGSIGFPVNWGEASGSSSSLIIEIKDGIELGVNLS